MSEDTDLNPVELAAEITIAWLGNANNRVAAEDVPTFIKAVHATISELAGGASSGSVEEPSVEVVPAVSVRRSLASRDHILSMIDGKPYKTLTRHLSRHGLTPAQYRERYGLKPDYPMVAESYTEHRRALAKRIGLGRKPAAAVNGTPAAAPSKAAPKRKAAAKARDAAE